MSENLLFLTVLSDTRFVPNFCCFLSVKQFFWFICDVRETKKISKCVMRNRTQVFRTPVGCCSLHYFSQQVVSTSRTPGHTKHFQTIFLTPNVRLCDCPGLVFPSVVGKQLQVQCYQSYVVVYNKVLNSVLCSLHLVTGL